MGRWPPRALPSAHRRTVARRGTIDVAPRQ
jgi:hypothetical protein